MLYIDVGLLLMHMRCYPTTIRAFTELVLLFVQCSKLINQNTSNYRLVSSSLFSLILSAFIQYTSI